MNPGPRDLLSKEPSLLKLFQPNNWENVKYLTNQVQTCVKIFYNDPEALIMLENTRVCL